MNMKGVNERENGKKDKTTLVVTINLEKNHARGGFLEMPKKDFCCPFRIIFVCFA
jgi:hypothetical protein